MFSRKFIDTPESNISVEGIMNLHNNEAGRRVSVILTKNLKILILMNVLKYMKFK